jgi:hypothetical protein
MLFGNRSRLAVCVYLGEFTSGELFLKYLRYIAFDDFEIHTKLAQEIQATSGGRSENYLFHSINATFPVRANRSAGLLCDQ